MTARTERVPADAAELPGLTQFLHRFWSEAALPGSAAAAFELALEEIFMNVVMHGSRYGRVPEVCVSLALVDGAVHMSVEDDGPPFDPLSLPPPNVAAGLEERRVGGLGVFLVRKLMDSVHYRRRGSHNALTMQKRMVPGGVA